MKFCNQCGAQLEDDMLFCNMCGAKQEAPAAPAAEPVAPVAEPVAEPVAPAPEAAPVPETAAPEVIPEAVPVIAPASGYMQEAAPVYTPEPVAPVPAQPAPKKKSKLGLIIGLIVGVLVIAGGVIAGILIYKNSKKETIDASQLVKVIGYGPNGHGSAAVVLANKNAMQELMEYDDDENPYPGLWLYLYEMVDDDEEKYPSGVTSWIEEQVSPYFSGTKAYKTINEDQASEAKGALKKLKVTVEDEGKGAGNYGVGDTITIKVKGDEDALKKAHVVLKNTTFEYTFTEADFAECTPIDPFKGFEFTCEGYNGSGKIEYSYDGVDEVAKYLFSYSPNYDELYEAKSNGDKVTFTASTWGDLSKGYLKSNGKYYSVKESDLTKVFEVSGLEELTEIDIFEGIAFKYSGRAPKLSVTIDKSEMDELLQNNVTYRLDKSTGLAIGDTITVTATIYSDRRLNEEGYTYDHEKMTYEFVIPETAPHVFEKDDEILKTTDPEKLFGLEDKFEAAVGGTQFIAGIQAPGTIVEFISVKYDKAYFFVQPQNNSINNELWQLAEAQFKFNIGGVEQVQTVYFTCQFDGIFLDDSGNVANSNGQFTINYYAGEKDKALSQSDAIAALENVTKYELR